MDTDAVITAFMNYHTHLLSARIQGNTLKEYEVMAEEACCDAISQYAILIKEGIARRRRELNEDDLDGPR
jgi:hypothetical protein